MCTIVKMALCCVIAVVFFQNGFSQNQPVIAPPIAITSVNPGNCYDKEVKLTVPNGETNLQAVSGSQIIYEYTNTTPTPSSTYLPIGIGLPTNQISFVPLNVFASGQIAMQTQKYIRVRHVLGTNTIATSLTIPISFSPSAPNFTGSSLDGLITFPSCTTTPTGSIRVTLQKYTDTILYIVKPSSDPTFCNPLTNNPPCFNVIKSGKTADTNFLITGIAAGDYRVIISNIGDVYGTCNNAVSALVVNLPPIAIDNQNANNPVCFDDNNGKIILNVSGGDSNTYHYNIFPNRGTKRYHNSIVYFEGLNAGNYTVNFTDTCGTILTRSFQLTHPPKVEGIVVKTIPNCASPGNGAIKVFAKYNFAASGYTTFDYRIYKDGVCTDSLLNTTDTSFVVNGLTGGNYRAVALSTQNSNCPGIDESFVLPFAPLTIAIDSIKNVDCNGQTNGYVRLKSTGGTNQYFFTIRNNTTGQTTIDTLGIFSNISPATYTAIVKNKTTTCADSAVQQFTINQPANINSTLAKQDIQCYNFDNGTLTATASGGNGGYIYYWEKQNAGNGSWVSYPQIGANISGLNAGMYRSKITDSKNCSGVSLPIQIIEPDSLKIDSVKVSDIPCFAGSGFIKIHSSGGNIGHIQQYRKLPDANYTSFTPTTGLQAGAYLVRVTDSRNCTTYYADTLTITSPPNNLTFTYTQTVLNGYNITCFGADNGTITITADGGNGDGYTGYFYTYDNQPWQTNNVLTGIPAGNRIIKVKDGRGCIKQETVLFTQPNDSLTVQLLNKTDIICYNESIGAFTVKATGGVRPYRYTINNGTTYQTDSTFINLAPGTYNLMVRDNNDCAGYLTVTINNVNGVLAVSSAITTVSCFGGNNGSISTSVSGGVAPYNLLWTPSNATTGTINNLAAGTYNVRVTDAVGCIKNFPVIVDQPNALTPQLIPYSVCYGATTGKIAVPVVGGTAPYQYAINNGVFQSDSIFANLAQGSYTIKVKDAKNCEWTGTSIVPMVTNNPNLNFIISSNQHATDTVTMKEISWVKPDSIKWEFHPAAVILDNNRLEPKIKFNAPDTGQGYWVKLIGHYPTCTYVTQKNIKIYPYDPNAVVTPSTYNKGIKKAELFPNPNSGQFTLNVEFYKMQKVTVYITSLSGVIVVPKQTFPITMHLLKNYTTEMNLQQPGTYVLRIVSDYDSKYILFVKQ